VNADKNLNKNEQDPSPTVLVVGATGFVGRYVHPALIAQGFEVRCASRDPQRALRDFPDRTWVRVDLSDSSTLAPALEGCTHALYLAHSLQAGADYPEIEQQSARSFCEVAEKQGVSRVVYLGGVQPTGKASQHLASRMRIGEILRSAAFTTIELRAAMIIGHGSASWTIVRDLAARLPAMILPRWLRYHSWPIAVDDVVRALLHALRMPLQNSAWFDIPGPQRISHRALLTRTAVALGKRPWMLSVPFLSPKLSSYWIGAVTRAPLSLSQELVSGLQSDLDPGGSVLWDVMKSAPATGLDQAIRDALSDEKDDAIPSRAAVGRILALAAS